MGISPGSVDALGYCILRDDLQFHGYLLRVGDTDRLAALLKLSNKVRIEILKVVEGFPSEHFVFARSDPSQGEVSLLIGHFGLIESDLVSRTVRDQDGAHARYGLVVGVAKCSFDLATFGADRKFQYTGRRFRDSPSIPKNICRIV